MKKILIPLLIILFLSSCSAKKEYIYVKPKPFNFQVVEIPKEREIRVYSEDMELYKGYIKLLRKHISIYVLQIQDYKKTFKENKEEKGK